MIVEHGVLGPDFRPAASVEDALTRAHADGGVAWVALQDPEEATDLRRRTEERLAELAEAAAPSEWMAVVALMLVHFDEYDRMLHRIEDAVESLDDRLSRPRTTPSWKTPTAPTSGSRAADGPSDCSHMGWPRPPRTTTWPLTPRSAGRSCGCAGRPRILFSG